MAEPPAEEVAQNQGEAEVDEEGEDEEYDDAEMEARVNALYDSRLSMAQEILAEIQAKRTEIYQQVGQNQNEQAAREDIKDAAVISPPVRPTPLGARQQPEVIEMVDPVQQPQSLVEREEVKEEVKGEEK